MGFFLASPVFLWGLLASLIPLVLHLERRRSARTVPFTMLRFLRDVERRRFLNLRILELLLLFLRMAILALIALALAGPALSFPGGAPAWARLFTSSGEHQDTVILLDTSSSMRAETLGDTPWTRAKDVLLETARRPRIRPVLTVYPFSGGLDRPAETLPPAPLPADLAAALDDIEPDGTATDVGKALGQVATQVRSIQGSEVVVVTDLQRNGWESILSGAASLPEGLRLTVVDTGLRPAPNLWLEGLETPPLPWGSGQDELVRFSVRNSGYEEGESAAAEIDLFEEPDRLIQKRPVVLTPGVNLLLEWVVRAGSGEVFRGRIVLDPAETAPDSLEFDNVLDLEVPVLSDRNAVVIGPAEPLTRSSLTLALSPPGEEGAPPFLQASFADSLSDAPAELSTYDFVVLTLTPGATYPDDALIALERFVGDGGGLLLVPNALSRVTEEDSTMSLDAVDSVLARFGIELGGVRTSGEPFTPAWLRKDHPVFVSLEDVPGSSFETVEVRQWLAVGGDLADLIAMAPPGTDRTRGVRLLAERQFGSGVVLVLATGLERDSSDLAVSPLFVPLFDALAKYLIAQPGDSGGPSAKETRAESNLARLTAADREILEDRMDVRFLSASALGSGIPSRSVGGSLTGFLLLLALGCALAELWLSNTTL
jgi:hypothetical protein